MCGHVDVSAQQPGMVWSLSFSVQCLSLHRPCQGHNHPLLSVTKTSERLWDRKFFSAQSHASARELPSNEHIAAAEIYSAESFGLKICLVSHTDSGCSLDGGETWGAPTFTHRRTVLASLIQLLQILKAIDTVLKWTNKWKEYTFELWDRKKSVPQKCHTIFNHI